MLAKVCFAAASMEDKEFSQGIDNVLQFYIEGAKTAGAEAEYILSILDSQLAILSEKELEAKINVNLTNS